MEKTEFINKYLNFHSYVRPVDAEPMYDALVELPEKGRMLEIGTGMGHSTLFFAKLKPKWMIYTVDILGIIPPRHHDEKDKKPYGKQPHYWPDKRDVQNMIGRWHNAEAYNIIPIVASSYDLTWELEVNALFIDGDHFYEGVKNDWDKFSPFVKKGGAVMFHDYSDNQPWYCDVKEFVDKEVKPKYEIITGGVTAVIHIK